tara:strand:+ start:501 stop:698 length:198 start_codon:yes stop_codon:yes gene_type:complete
MNNGGPTYKYSIDVGDNYGIVSSYISYCSYGKDGMEVLPKTTHFEVTISTGEETRGKGNQKGKED